MLFSPGVPVSLLSTITQGAMPGAIVMLYS